MKAIMTSLFALFVVLCVFSYPSAAHPACDENLPAPDVDLVGFELSADADGNPLAVYKLSVMNSSAYPAELFAHAADLPACDSGTHNARTRVDIIAEEDDSYVGGFCDLSSPEDLASILFSCSPDDAPVGVYVTLTDRSCGLTYTSDIVPIPPQ